MDLVQGMEYLQNYRKGWRGIQGATADNSFWEHTILTFIQK